MSQVEKDLYILVGKYEATCEQIFERLGKIDEKLEDGSKSFIKLKSEIADHEYRFKEIEEHGIPRRTRLEIRGSSITAAALAIWEALKLLKGWIH